MSSNGWSYEERFNIEIDGWCYGVENYPGEFYPNLVHIIIREMKGMFRVAFERGLIFDVIDIAQKFSKASKFRIHEKEVAFSILAQFPHPNTLNEDGQFTMAQVLDRVEQVYGGVLERLQRRWSGDKPRQAA